MELGISTRVALVCGASTGLGYACAHRLAQEGARLILCSRHAARLQAACERIREDTGVEAIPIPADLTLREEIEKLFTLSVERYGQIDILVHNTGGPPLGTFFEQEDEAWYRACDLLLMSFVRLCRLILPLMQAQRWGRVVSITSQVVREPADDLILSVAFRSGIVGVAKSLAHLLAPYNVLINTVLPGPFQTERAAELLQQRAERSGQTVEALRAQIASLLPTGRYGEPEELATLVAYLVSERNGYLTGAAIPIEGGVMKGVW